MATQDGAFVIVFNGEIYNYIELRSELRKLGYKFRTNTDTEVILSAYEEWGIECLEKFNGMWAFAIWDRIKRQLFLSRDRFGIKPLYYIYNKNVFAFASEIKALTHVYPTLKEVNYSHLHRFFKYHLLDDNGQTCFKHIKELPGGEYLILKNNRLTRTTYWNYSPQQNINSENSLTDSEYGEQFKDILIDSVRLRMRSDVPLGVCLSGGLDSSSITSMMTGKNNKFPVKTFSAFYPIPNFDESGYVKNMEEKFRLESYYTTPTPEEFWQNFDTFSYYMDQPVLNPGPFTQWFVMKLAQGKVKVLLDGQGGDEILAGYFHYFPYYLNSLLFNRPPPNRLDISLINIFKRIQSMTKLSHRRLFFQALSPDISWRDLNFISHFFPDKQPFFHDEFDRYKKEYEVKNIYRGTRNIDSLTDRQFETFKYTVLPRLLRYEDRNSMASSLEARLPFLDYRLVEFCFNLPYWQRINGTTTKYILRNALANELPRGILTRKDKMGFNTPFGMWIRNELFAQVQEILTSSRFKERYLIDQTYIKNVFEKHKNGQDLSWILWKFL